MSIAISQACIRVVDDQLSVREAVADLLASVGMATRLYPSAGDFLRNDDLDQPGCVVADVRMPDMGGFELMSELTRRRIELPLVFVTGHGDVDMAVQALKAGAVDFLTKPFDDQRLIDAINQALRFDAARRASTALALAAQRRLATLTKGERDVLALLVEGRRNKQIAEQLNVSEITVKVRRARILHKLEADSLPELVRVYDCAAGREACKLAPSPPDFGQR